MAALRSDAFTEIKTNIKYSDQFNAFQHINKKEDNYFPKNTLSVLTKQKINVIIIIL